jgi:hypothetical protein
VNGPWPDPSWTPPARVTVSSLLLNLKPIVAAQKARWAKAKEAERESAGLLGDISPPNNADQWGKTAQGGRGRDAEAANYLGSRVTGVSCRYFDSTAMKHKK